MEPFSISTGVISLLCAVLKVSVELKKLKSGATDGKSTVTAMLSDAKALRTVLEAIETSFEELDSTPLLMGNIATHLANLRVVLEDGSDRFTTVETLLIDIKKDVSLMDSTQRKLKLRTAEEQLVVLRQEIQAYKDALQLSLHAVTL
jgi:hypothetical protein